MRVRRTCELPLVALICHASVISAFAQAPPASAFDWVLATPESQGISSARLDAVRNSIAGTTQALLVIRNDRLVYEWYAPGRTPKDKHSTASMAKAIVGGLSLAVALTGGLMTIDDRASKYIPQWK